MEKIIYVIGHKNPDTDSAASAAAYAALKQTQGATKLPGRQGGKYEPSNRICF